MFDIKYQGEKVPALGINPGDSMNSVIKKVADAIVTIQNAPAPTPGVTGVPANEVEFVGNLHGLSTGASGRDAAMLGTRRFTYMIEVSGNRTSLGVDLTPAITNLPQGYALVFTECRVMGQVKQGSTLLTDTSLPVFNVPVDLDRYPITLKVTVRMTSPGGVVLLIASVPIEGPVVGSYQGVLDASGFESPNAQRLTQAEVNEILASALFSTKTMADVVPHLRNQLLTLSTQVADLEKGVTTIANVQTTVDQLSTSVASLSADVTAVKNNTSSGGTSTDGTATGGSTNGGSLTGGGSTTGSSTTGGSPNGGCLTC